MKFSERIASLKPLYQRVLVALGLIWKHSRIRVISSTLYIILGGALTLLSAYYFRKALLSLNDISHFKNFWESGSFKYLAIASGVTLFSGVWRLIYEYFSEIHGFAFSTFIQDSINEKVIKLKMSFLESPGYHNLLERAKFTGSSKIDGIFFSLVTLINSLISILIFSTFIYMISWQIVVLILILNIPLILTNSHFTKKMFELRKEQTPIERKANYFGGIIMDISIAKEIKTFHIGNFFLDRFKVLRDQLFLQRMKLVAREKRMRIFTLLTTNVVWFIAVIVIFRLISKGLIPLVDLTFMMTMILQLIHRGKELSGSINGLYHCSLEVSYVLDFLELKDEIESDFEMDSVKDQNTNDNRNTVNGEIVADEILVKNVSFTYSNSNTNFSLKNVSLTIPKGKIVALVGLNGTGKTTLIKLLARMYEPTSGEIFIGDVPIKNIPRKKYHKHISFIFQDYAKYHLTIEENIAIGDLEKYRNDKNIKRYAQQSGADGFIEKLPDAYNSLLGRMFDEGIDISIGQWQKVAIARSLYKDTSFIVMDEPTSAMDAVAEKTFFQEFKNAIGDRGALLVSHRMSAVQYADYIYVLNEGELEEEGTHNSLLDKEGLYYWIFKSGEKLGNLDR